MVLPAGFQLALLLFAVPLQYFLMSQISVSDVELRVKAANFMSKLQNIYNWSHEVWKSSSDTTKMVEKFLNFFMSPAAGRPAASTSKVDLGSGKFEDEEAVEVLREEEKWFGRSSEIRQQRPKDLEFRVGQVVRHTEWGWRGVITGWDKQAKVPDYFLEEHGLSDQHSLLRQPWYQILVDAEDREFQTAYIPQHMLSADLQPQLGISHPELKTYFKAGLDREFRYVMLPWLRERYPND